MIVGVPSGSGANTPREQAFVDLIEDFIDQVQLSYNGIAQDAVDKTKGTEFEYPIEAINKEMTMFNTVLLQMLYAFKRRGMGISQEAFTIMMFMTTQVENAFADD